MSEVKDPVKNFEDVNSVFIRGKIVGLNPIKSIRENREIEELVMDVTCESSDNSQGVRNTERICVYWSGFYKDNIIKQAHLKQRVTIIGTLLTSSDYENARVYGISMKPTPMINSDHLGLRTRKIYEPDHNDIVLGGTIMSIFTPSLGANTGKVVRATIRTIVNTRHSYCNVVFFGGAARYFSSQCKRGDRVHMFCHFQTSQYRQDNAAVHYSDAIVCHEVQRYAGLSEVLPPPKSKGEKENDNEPDGTTKTDKPTEPEQEAPLATNKEEKNIASAADNADDSKPANDSFEFDEQAVSNFLKEMESDPKK